jgi:[ribosomal protein S5]-alanine N-acetyltransferase
MRKTSWALTIETERLILRPLEPSDYESWYAGFSGRLPQQQNYSSLQVYEEHPFLANLTIKATTQ